LEFIGWCGLKYLPETNEVDLGYRFMKKFWGNGYATEAALACIEYGFTRLNLRLVVGRALPANLASIKVLEKCGMKYLHEEVMHGYLHKTYQVTNPAIKS
jgi:RimJ/RimL family protein N-acetyltransferase